MVKQGDKVLRKQRTEPGVVLNSIIWIRENSMVIVGLLVAILGLAMAIWIVYMALLSSPEVIPDEVVGFTTESSRPETSVAGKAVPVEGCGGSCK